uniref:Zinc finger and BTB domain containing 5 n=1 Tax=Oreochromis niloticus TaxID=8128 RepID=A0A669BPV4_ORENI
MNFPSHFQHIFKQLNHQRLQAQLCDCVVVVGGQTFQAHRSILAACSSHFRALLTSSDTADEAGGSGADRCRDGPSVIELDPEVVTPESFSTLLDMIYTSTLSLGTSNVMDVLLAASHLHLNAVVKACKIHLSRKNFPASAPKGWRSVQQQEQESPSSQLAGSSQQRVTSGLEEDLDKEEMGEEVSQSVGDEDCVVIVGHKRKLHEDRLSDRKRTSRLPGENYKECSPTVTRSCVSHEDRGEALLSTGCLQITDALWENQGDEEEKKYKAPKGELEEIQLPSQSDSSIGGVWEKGEDTDGDGVVKVKVGEEEGDRPQMPVIEVKKENLSSYSPDLLTTLPALVDAGEQDQKSDEANTSTAQSSDSSSSLIFPVTSVPLQQLLPTQSPGFSDTIILQPTQNSLTGFLSTVRPPLSVGLRSNNLPSNRPQNATWIRIWHRAFPWLWGDAADRPPLTRASEDVLSKCKKAAAEDHVLLVEGEKKYACKICCKTFMNLTDCKKHIRVHTGEKPYPCPKCGKRFSQSSHLYKHSKNTCLNWKDDQSLADTLL